MQAFFCCGFRETGGIFSYSDELLFRLAFREERRSAFCFGFLYILR